MTRPKKRFPQLLYLLTALVCLILAGVSLWSNNLRVPTDALPTPDELNLLPESYAGNVVIPYNIAPLNFNIGNKASEYITCFTSTKGKPIVVKGKNVRISKRLWRQLLESNKGNALYATVYVKRDGVWFFFPSVRFQIAPDPIDTWLVYLLSEPAGANVGSVKLVKRELESFKEKELAVLKKGEPTLYLALSPAVHPSLPIVAFTSDGSRIPINFLNEAAPTSFSQGASIRLTSTEGAFNEIPQHQNPLKSIREAFPSWSRDGKYLYASLATGSGLSSGFHLIRRPFYATSLKTGPADTLINTRLLKKSAVTPQLSPDGKYLLFCLTTDGNQPLWHKSSDLYVLNLSDGAWKSLSIANSIDVDNQPVWSSNGRWIVFGSNRQDGTYTRLYIAYFDAEGTVHKPFILPQRNPTTNDNLFKSYLAPAVVSKPNTTAQLRMMSFMIDAFDSH